jgi:hypothetical protein
VRELLEGRRIGFALRPPLGGIAVGTGLAVTLLDLMAWSGWATRDTNALVVGAQWLSVATAVVALFGVATALAEVADVPAEDATLARLDVVAVAAATVLYGVTAVLRAFDVSGTGAIPPAASPAALLLALAGLVVLLAGSATSSLLYAAREWEEIEEIAHERHGRRRTASR